MYVLGAKSRSNLLGVHPVLVQVVKRAIQITEVDFTVFEGLRNLERQKELVAKGFSKTMNSRHLTGHAVDLVANINGKLSWDEKHYYFINKAMKQAARELGVNIRWGGEFKSFFDGPHFEIDPKVYK